MTIKPISLTLIVAATNSNAIGISSGLPWRLPKEMAYFAAVTQSVSNLPSTSAATTTGNDSVASMNAVIMGRKSWEGIPKRFRPLGGRRNIIVSRQSDYDLTDSAHSHLASSLPSALSILSSPTLSPPLNRTFLIGGAQLYSHSLLSPPHESYSTDRILLTRIKDDFENCDAWFPELRSAETLADEKVESRVGEEKAEGWKRASHKELIDWVGFEVPEGDQVEVDRNSKREIRYEFQMWLKL